VLGIFDEDDITCTDPALLPLARLEIRVKKSSMFCFVPVSSDGSAGRKKYEIQARGTTIRGLSLFCKIII
jgi:hypothetical protein